MKTFIKSLILTYIPTIFFLILLFDCKPAPQITEPLTLQSQIKGKTYILGTVTNNGDNVTSEFTGFKISFNAEGTSCTITSPSKPCLNTIENINIGTNTITFTGTASSCKSNIATSVSATADGITLVFDMTLVLSSIVIDPTDRSSAIDTHKFSLVRQ